MSLEELIQARRLGTQPEAEGLITPSADQPVGVASSTTPAGLEIYYQAGPKRLYRVRTYVEPGYPVDWTEVPSVSKILDVLHKPLDTWGMKVGIDGLRTLVEMGVLDETVGTAILTDDEAAEINVPEWAHRTTDEIVEILKEHKLTPYYVKNAAGTRGTNVHTALESWVEYGVTPDPQFYPENERGYVEGLIAFIEDAHPTAHFSELMVASVEHGFAGRFDLFANLDFAGGGRVGQGVVTRTYPKKNPVRSDVGGNWLLDLKTSKGVYPSYKIQLAAYRLGMIECGYPAPDHLGVIRVTEDGRYELVESHATAEDFLAVQAAYHAVRGNK